MPLQHRSHPNWQVAVQGESNWRCRIKHKWHYLNEKKLRACERCGQLAGHRDYLRWLIDSPDWATLSRAGKQLQRLHEKAILPPMPNPPPAPPPKRTPWHDREQFELANAPPPPVPPPMKELLDGVIPKRPAGHVYDLESRQYKPHGAGPGGAGVPYRPYGDGPRRKNWIGLFP